MVFSLRPTAIEMRNELHKKGALGNSGPASATKEEVKAPVSGSLQSATPTSQSNQLSTPLAANASSQVTTPRDKAETPGNSQVSELDASICSQYSIAPSELNSSQRLNDSLNTSNYADDNEEKKVSSQLPTLHEAEEMKLSDAEMDRQLFSTGPIKSESPLPSSQLADHNQNATPERVPTPSAPSSIGSSSEATTLALPSKTATTTSTESLKPATVSKVSSRQSSRPHSPVSDLSPQHADSALESHPREVLTPSTPVTKTHESTKPAGSSSDLSPISETSQSTESTANPIDDAPPCHRTRSSLDSSTQSSLKIFLPKSVVDDFQLTLLYESERQKKLVLESKPSDSIPAPTAVSDAPSTAPVTCNASPTSVASAAASAPSSPPKSIATLSAAAAAPSTPSSTDAISPTSRGRLQFSIVARSTPYVLNPKSTAGAVFVNASESSSPILKPVESATPLIFNGPSSPTRLVPLPQPIKLEGLDSDDDLRSETLESSDDEDDPNNTSYDMHGLKKPRYGVEKDDRSPEHIAKRMRKPIPPYDPDKAVRKQPDRSARHFERPQGPPTPPPEPVQTPARISRSQSSNTPRSLIDKTKTPHTPTATRSSSSTAESSYKTPTSSSSKMDVDEPDSSGKKRNRRSYFDPGRIPRVTRSAAAAEEAAQAIHAVSTLSSPVPSSVTSPGPQMLVSPPKSLSEPLLPSDVAIDPLEPYIKPDGKIEWSIVLSRCVSLEPLRSLEFAAIIQMGQNGEIAIEREAAGSMAQVQARFSLDGAKSFVRSILMSDPAVKEAVAKRSSDSSKSVASNSADMNSGDSSSRRHPLSPTSLQNLRNGSKDTNSTSLTLGKGRIRETDENSLNHNGGKINEEDDSSVKSEVVEGATIYEVDEEGHSRRRGMPRQARNNPLVPTEAMISPPSEKAPKQGRSKLSNGTDTPTSTDRRSIARSLADLDASHSEDESSQTNEEDEIEESNGRDTASGAKYKRPDSKFGGARFRRRMGRLIENAASVTQVPTNRPNPRDGLRREQESQEMEDHAAWCRWAGARVILLPPTQQDIDFSNLMDAFSAAATEIRARDVAQRKADRDSPIPRHSRSKGRIQDGTTSDGDQDGPSYTGRQRLSLDKLRELGQNRRQFQSDPVSIKTSQSSLSSSLTGLPENLESGTSLASLAASNQLSPPISLAIDDPDQSIRSSDVESEGEDIALSTLSSLTVRRRAEVSRVSEDASYFVKKMGVISYNQSGRPIRKTKDQSVRIDADVEQQPKRKSRKSQPSDSDPSPTLTSPLPDSIGLDILAASERILSKIALEDENSNLSTSNNSKKRRPTESADELSSAPMAKKRSEAPEISETPDLPVEASIQNTTPNFLFPARAELL